MTELLLMTYLANALWMTCLVAAAAMVVGSSTAAPRFTGMRYG